MPDHRALDAILLPGGILPVFQPICAVAGGRHTITGYECLSRGPRGTNLEAANVLFDYVRLKREESAVDRVCIRAALVAARILPLQARLCINVHASTLGRDAGFVDFLRNTMDDCGIGMNRLTVEVVEHAPPWDDLAFLATLDRLRMLGVAIALDDVGLGQSNFKMLLDVRPDYMKIDRYFVVRCAEDPDRQAVIEVVNGLARHFGAQVIAEGVEDLATLQTLERLGIGLMQGFYFSRPMEALAAGAMYGASRAYPVAL